MNKNIDPNLQLIVFFNLKTREKFVSLNVLIKGNIRLHIINVVFVNSKMMQSRKELAEKDRKAVFTREIVTKNPIFSKEHCQDFFEMFNLYCDNRRQCDVSDILNTARTLGFDKKYKIIFQALSSVSRELAGEWVNFETFLTLITNRVGNPFTENGRQAMFSLVDADEKGKLQFQDLKRVSEQLKYNLSDEQIQEVINNVSGFGRKEISKEQFNKYIVRKLQRK